MARRRSRRRSRLARATALVHATLVVLVAALVGLCLAGLAAGAHVPDGLIGLAFVAVLIVMWASPRRGRSRRRRL